MSFDLARRMFLKSATMACLAASKCLSAIASNSSALSALGVRLSRDPRRPQFHLLPTHNWMNDPNGPIYFDGMYHMFFQYNPKAAIWGNMSWNHAVSKDMLHWRNCPIAFTMSPDSPDADGCFSGSAICTEHHGKRRVYVVYTGVVKDKDHATLRGEDLRESQCLAWSEDPMLMKWTKASGPVISGPPAGLSVTGFRDPSVWKEADHYFLTVGSGITKVGGCVLLYRSKDLRDWEFLHPLVEGAWSGNYTENPVGDGEMWECPDFFSLGERHLLIYSTMGKVIWQSGTLDRSSLRFSPEKTGLLDLDAFYAPKTQLDAAGRRILWGWIPERRSKAEMNEAGWSGLMSLPRELRLDRDGVLQMEFLPDAVKLRRAEIVGKQTQTGRLLNIQNATGEFLCTGIRLNNLKVSIASGTVMLLEVEYIADKHAWLAQGEYLRLQESDTPEVHGFVDGSVIEVLLSRRIGCTKRFYYSGDEAPAVTIRADGSLHSFAAWTINPISHDRLSSPPL